MKNFSDYSVSSCFCEKASQTQGIWGSYLTKALDIFEDDQVLFVERWNDKLIVYDFKNHTFKLTVMFRSLPEICTESLISPCS
ncbi:hypothetical protein RYX36_037222 [Vicia faba]